MSARKDASPRSNEGSGPESGESPPSGEEATFTGRFGVSREMTEDEVQDLLGRSWWGNLATVDDDGPYAVPVIYGWNGRDFYIASRKGRKIANLDRNPAVCLTVVEAKGLGEPWYSVVVLGDAELVKGPRGHIEAIRALRGQVGREGEVTAKAVARMAAAKVIRISPREVTGRIRIS